MGPAHIIKDVMIRQSGEREQPKKGHKTIRNRMPVPPARDVPVEEEIDPADFFDPEEFGIRRQDSNR